MKHMNTNEQKVNQTKEKKFTILFLAVLTVFTFTCMAILISNYDSLARYPYESESSRAKIKKYLNRDEIEYIIEKSIGPNMFINYIDQDGFNLYHAEDYKELARVKWDYTPKQIVNMVEESHDLISTKNLAELLQEDNYTYPNVMEFLRNKNPYAPSAHLVLNPKDMDVYVDREHTIYKRFPTHLVEMEKDIPTNGHTILIDQRLQEPLKQMLKAMQQDLHKEEEPFSLYIENGFISYEKQEELFKKATEEYGDDATCHQFLPGCSEHQLGLAIDFAIPGLSGTAFGKSEEGIWLKQHAHEYGFVQTYTKESEPFTKMDPKPYHFRYVGLEKALELNKEKKTFAQDVLEEKPEKKQETKQKA